MTHPRGARTRTRFEVWAWSPIIIFRIALISTYFIYVYCGIIAVVAGVPVFNITAPADWATIWGAILSVSALVSGIGALDDRWQIWERWASLVLSGLMLAYTGSLNYIAYGDNDLDRMFVGGIAVIALVVPVCRFGWLASKAGKRKAPDP